MAGVAESGLRVGLKLGAHENALTNPRSPVTQGIDPAHVSGWGEAGCALTRSLKSAAAENAPLCARSIVVQRFCPAAVSTQRETARDPRLVSKQPLTRTPFHARDLLSHKGFALLT